MIKNQLTFTYIYIYIFVYFYIFVYLYIFTYLYIEQIFFFFFFIYILYYILIYSYQSGIRHSHRGLGTCARALVLIPPSQAGLRQRQSPAVYLRQGFGASAPKPRRSLQYINNFGPK